MDGGVDVLKGPLKVHKSIGDVVRPGMMAVKFRIESSADDPIAVRLVEHLPAEVSKDAIGFHSDYHADGWSLNAAEDLAVFEETVEPDGVLETRLAVPARSREDLEPYMQPPSVDYRVVEVGTGREHGARRQDPLAALFGREWRTSGLHEVDDATGVPARDRRPSAPSGDLLATGDRDTRAGRAATDRDDPEREDRRPADQQTTSSSGETSLVSALVAELQGGTADEEEIAVLRDALGVEHPESTRIRLRYLQSQLDDLMVYADEFEELVDAEGRPTQLVANVRAAIRELATRYERHEEAIDEVRDDQEEVAERLGRVEAELDRFDQLDNSLHRIRNELSKIAAEADTDTREVEHRLEELSSAYETHTETIETELRELRDRIDQNTTWRQRVQDTFENLSDESRLVR